MGGSISVRLNNRGIAAVTHRRTLAVARTALNDSARRVNVDTGYLRSTRAIQDRGAIIRLVYRAKYAKAVHDGSRPHIIRVVNKKVLSSGPGGQVFGRSVNHPGYGGNPYLTSAVAATLRRYARTARR